MQWGKPCVLPPGHLPTHTANPHHALIRSWTSRQKMPSILVLDQARVLPSQCDHLHHRMLRRAQRITKHQCHSAARLSTTHSLMISTQSERALIMKQRRLTTRSSVRCTQSMDPIPSSATCVSRASRRAFALTNSPHATATTWDSASQHVGG